MYVGINNYRGSQINIFLYPWHLGHPSPRDGCIVEAGTSLRERHTRHEVTGVNLGHHIYLI